MNDTEYNLVIMRYTLYHIMVKNTTLREDKVLKQIKKTFDTYRFGIHLDLARLIRPEQMRYKNRSRLENDFTANTKQNFLDMKLIIQNLDSKHQSDIFTSKQFNSFVQTWLQYARTDKEQDHLALLYPSLLKIALTGMRQNMPVEFKESIDHHYKPLMKLLEAISKTSKSENTIFGSEEQIEGRDYI